MPDAEFVYRGDLARTSLPTVLATVHRYGVPGVMIFEREGEGKRVYFADGDIIFATSTDPGDSLGEHLLRKGQITRAQYEVSSREMARSSGMRHGAVLVQMGFLSVEGLGAAIREQVQHILWSLFNWEEGRIDFRVGRFPEEEIHRVTIPTPRAILSGCKRIANARLVTERLGGRQTILIHQEWPSHLEGFRLQKGEQALLDLVDGRLTLDQLCDLGPMSPGINARVLYALSELGILGRSELLPGHIKIQVRNVPE